mmetsp:Transcript_10450/g.32410  ORF Transcript_10450/g.32410 Transcript_10450/m.32410 type:complete len:257 (-) Transcript_10450:54-824(-)
MATMGVVANVQPTNALVDLDDDERKVLGSLRWQAIGCGVASLCGAVTCWIPFVTPLVTFFITAPTVYVAHTRMQNVTQLLHGETCFCHCCGPVPRDTLKACRPMIFVCLAFAMLSVVTHVIFMFTFGRPTRPPLEGDPLPYVNVVCMALMIAASYGLGYFAYNFPKALKVFDDVTARQDIQLTVLRGVAGVANCAVVGQAAGTYGGRPQPAAPQYGYRQTSYAQPGHPPVQYGQQQPHYGHQHQQHQWTGQRQYPV